MSDRSVKENLSIVYKDLNTLKCGQMTKIDPIAQLNMLKKMVTFPPHLLFCDRNHSQLSHVSTRTAAPSELSHVSIRDKSN